MSKLIMMLSRECDHCGSLEERVFTDSWTGLELCCTCLHQVIGDVTMSPASEGDNLKKVLAQTDSTPTAWV